MKTATTVLYWMVLGGHVLAILSTIVYVGTLLPAQSQAEFGLTILIVVAGGVVQVAAFYLQARCSAYRYRWWIAIPMMAITSLFTVGSVLSTSPNAYYVTTVDVAAALLGALVSCGLLTWLRQARASATTAQ